jgi:PII-like signaling protein
MVQLSGPALRMTVIVGENDTWHHRPVSTEIVVRAREAGMAGATVTRGIEGFGKRSIVHTSRLVSLSSDLPVVVTLVDEAPKIQSFLSDVEEVVHGGIVTVEEVEVVRYVGSHDQRSGDTPSR